jgi:hypothetical protein
VCIFSHNLLLFVGCFYFSHGPFTTIYCLLGIFVFTIGRSQHFVNCWEFFLAHRSSTSFSKSFWCLGRHLSIPFCSLQEMGCCYMHTQCTNPFLHSQQLFFLNTIQKYVFAHSQLVIPSFINYGVSLVLSTIHERIILSCIGTFVTKNYFLNSELECILEYFVVRSVGFSSVV